MQFVRIPKGAAKADKPDYPVLLVILWPTVLCACMLIMAAVTAYIAHIDVSRLLGYFNCTLATFFCLLVVIFIDTAKLASQRADEPLKLIRVRLMDRWQLLVLPAVILPIFLMAYTAAKCAIPYLVGYTWDGFWADADRMLFGEDVWRIARKILGTSQIGVWEWFYSVAWAAAFLFVTNAVTLYAKPRFVGVYFTAMLGTWFFGGSILAYAFSAAGPVFAPIYDPSLAERFGPIARWMNNSVGINPIATSQHYLEIAVRNHIAERAAGISAMPSMHLGTLSVFVMAARRTKWLVPALAFWAIIFVSSGFFGYHYWVDGIAAAFVAAACWYAAEAIYPPKRRLSRVFAGATELNSAC
jgi:PAP2 superfamily